MESAVHSIVLIILKCSLWFNSSLSSLPLSPLFLRCPVKNHISITQLNHHRSIECLFGRSSWSIEWCRKWSSELDTKRPSSHVDKFVFSETGYIGISSRNDSPGTDHMAKKIQSPSCSISDGQQGRYRTVQLLGPGQCVNEE